MTDPSTNQLRLEKSELVGAETMPNELPAISEPTGLEPTIEFAFRFPPASKIASNSQ